MKRMSRLINKREPKSITQSFRRRLALSASVFLAILAAGCSGSGGGTQTPTPSNPFEILERDLNAFSVVEPTQEQLDAVTSHHSYQHQDDTSVTNRLFHNVPSAYGLSNLQYAHAAGLSGKDTTVSVIAAAFNTSHVELADKTDAELTHRTGGAKLHLVINDLPDYEQDRIALLERDVDIQPTIDGDFEFRGTHIETTGSTGFVKEAGDTGTMMAVLIAGRDIARYDQQRNQISGDKDPTCNLADDNTCNPFDGGPYETMGGAFNTHLHLSSYLESNSQWLGFSRVADATLEAVEQANAANRPAVFQANDWSPNRGEDIRAGHKGLFFNNGDLRGITYSEVKVRQEAESETFEQALAHLISCQTNSCFDQFYPETFFAPEKDLVKDFERYREAVQEFGKTGVVAFSTGPAGTALPVMTALPEEYPELKDFWLAVRAYDWSVNITSGRGQSSPECGQAAAYCIVANGSYRSVDAEQFRNPTSGEVASFDITPTLDPVDTTDEFYAGRDYSAVATVGIATALMAEAFPGLSGKEMRNRLLASANPAPYFLVEAAQSFVTSVENNSSLCVTDNAPDNCTNFGTEAAPFWRTYNTSIGYGYLDIEAALKPLGEPTVQTAATIGASSLLDLPGFSGEAFTL